MVGWISDPIGNPIGEAQGFANVASQPFQGQEWLAPEKWLGALGSRNTALYGDVDPESGVTLSEPEPRLPAATLQKQFGVAPGFGVSGLTFTSDLPESVAADMQAAKLAEQRRADAAARTPGGLIAGVQRFGATAATQLLDPIGAASMMVPLGGEVEGATALARAGSALVRGAAAGAAVTAPFALVHKLYADNYGEDYSAGDALREILMGGLLGGGLHAGAVVAGDVIGRAFQGSAADRIVDDNPDIRHAAASEAVSAALDERPPQSAELINLVSAVKAADEEARPIADNRTAAPDAQPGAPEVPAAPIGAPEVPAAPIGAPEILVEPPPADGAARAPDASPLSPTGESPSGADQGAPAAVDTDQVARSQAEAQNAAGDIQTSIAQRAGVGGASPADASAVKLATDANARAAVPVRVEDAELAELHDVLRRADEAGALDPEHHATLAALDTQRQATDSWLKALPQAAACMLRSVA